VRPLAALGLALLLAACSSSGGPSTVVNQPTSNNTQLNAYNGPTPQNADTQAFEVNFWNNVRPTNRCGGCHYAGGQSPQFARSDDVNKAYAAALPEVNMTNPAQSAFVVQVGGGHNCWLGDNGACALTMQQWIQNWIGGGGATTSSVQLTAPPAQPVQSSKILPSPGDPTYAAALSAFGQDVWTPVLEKYCIDCHRPDSPTAQSPYFASTDVAQAYSYAQPLMNLNTPAQSRFVERLADELHHCWPTTPGGAPDCPGSATAMLNAITAFANTIPITPVDPSLLLSQQLALTQGTIASGGNRFDGSMIAKYEFQTGIGNTAYDTSGVNPEADLAFSSSSACTWVLGWGVSFAQGCKLQATTASSSKLTSLIQPTNAFSLEVWAAPANVAQTSAWIMSYSGSDTTRNVTLGQNAQQYEGLTRTSSTNTNGGTALMTSMAGMFAQAALQHVVLTYDPTHGQKIYVNGVYTGDADPSKPGTFATWDNTFALVLGGEVSGKEQWQGVIKLAAVHNAALTPAQVAQNFAAGVGQRYYLLFDVSSLSGIPGSYIVLLASQYDNYSYLLTHPTFLVLNSSTVPANFAIQGMRIGMNGAVLNQAQAWSTLNVTVGGSNYSTVNGQVLSGVGTVVPSDKGAANDMFFLSFDQFGTHLHAYVDPTQPSSAPTPSGTTPQPDVGVKTYAQLNYAMSAITGVPMSDQVVASVFNATQQSMPSSAQLAAFQSSQQMAISQLATAYCSELVANSSYRDAFFGSGLDGSLSSSGGTFFASTSNQNIVINPLVARAVGTGVAPTAASAIQAELPALFARIPSLPVTTPVTVQSATQAACTAVLGSGALLFQ
jgi:hypothetical protein